jgi:hypothetical protein
MSMRATVILVLLGSVLALPRAYADYACSEDYHQVTPEELATMTETLEAARAAVPAPPQGWVNTLNDDSVSPPTSFCPDFYPWSYRYGRNYSRVEGAEERERVIAAAGAEFRAAMDAKQPRLDALQAQMSELSTQYAAAATSGDQAKAQEIYLEIERIGAESQRIMNEGDPVKAFEEATASQYVDLEMSVAVTVNSTQESPTDGAQTFEVPGAAAAYQWTSGDNGDQGNALVLFGEWRPSPSGFGLESVTPEGAAPEQPHAIAVRITAYKDRLPSMIEATDFDAMAALLAR